MEREAGRSSTCPLFFWPERPDAVLGTCPLLARALGWTRAWRIGGQNDQLCDPPERSTRGDRAEDSEWDRTFILQRKQTATP